MGFSDGIAESLKDESYEKARQESRKEVIAQIKTLIVKEINIARTEGEKTSRLTSLYNKIGKKAEIMV